MIIMKFGGTSVQNASAMKLAGAIVAGRASRQPVVIVSALAGITDCLIRSAECAAQGKEDAALKTQTQIATRHFQLVEELLRDSRLRNSTCQVVYETVREIQRVLESLAVLQDLTPRLLDRIMGYGEHLSSLIFAAHLWEKGVDAEWVDSRDVLITNGRHTDANPLMELSRRRVETVLLPRLARGLLPVIPGFTGATRDHVPTTLGRGGSDASATIFGALLRAEEIEIWTDVPGFMTADPRIVANATLIPLLSYAQASQLSHAGACVLHAKAVLYAQQENIPLWIRNTFEPERGGTVICSDAAARSLPALSFEPQNIEEI